MFSLLLPATSLLWWAVLMGVVFLHLGLMVEVESGRLLPAVGVANVLTMMRAFAAVWVAWAIGFSTGGNFVPLAVVFGVAMATDAADGFLARRAHQVTRWGRLYDPVVDGILFGTAAVGLTLRGVFPAWLAALVVFRYAFPIAGAVLFVLLKRRALRVRHTLWGQVSTFSIAGAVFLAATLLSLSGPWPLVAPGVFAAVAAAMALAVLTIIKRGLDQA
jgi:phosphatidylglycerophosphate synthase